MMDEGNAPHNLASWERKIKEMAKPRPIYKSASIRAVTALRYDCSAWIAEGDRFKFKRGLC